MLILRSLTVRKAWLCSQVFIGPPSPQGAGTQDESSQYPVKDVLL